MSSPAEPVRVLVVDDHPVVREGISALLEEALDVRVVAQAGDGESALDLFARHRPDVTIMDLGLPGMTGAETTAALRGRFGDVRIVILTVHEGDEDIYRALEAGARGYLLKSASGDRLVATVRAVASGLWRIPPEVSERLAQRVARPPLTPRERQILTLIVAGRGNKQIGADLAISEGTVKTHVNSLLAKLGVADRTEAAVAALQRGLVRPR